MSLFPLVVVGWSFAYLSRTVPCRYFISSFLKYFKFRNTLFHCVVLLLLLPLLSFSVSLLLLHSIWSIWIYLSIGVCFAHLVLFVCLLFGLTIVSDLSLVNWDFSHLKVHSYSLFVCSWFLTLHSLWSEKLFLPVRIPNDVRMCAVLLLPLLQHTHKHMSTLLFFSTHSILRHTCMRDLHNIVKQQQQQHQICRMIVATITYIYINRTTLQVYCILWRLFYYLGSLRNKHMLNM